ncbi:cilia- and flagella-associated protein 144-like [Limanda limanda]|uniref:cilia- and flagella-associated protein 144-like n=1 Tax=Limanda limanda TaxID=27771 RepID=UPI0029C85226|nr:cilia- and flagella-associated protein 144-like [Limanda limanda]
MKEKAKNKVHQDAIHQETIRKEQRQQTLYTKFTINPLKKLVVLSDKPTASKLKETIETTSELIEAFHYARQVPTKKYPEPLTESHMIGWRTEPLIPSDRFDRRFNYHRQSTDVTAGLVFSPEPS